MESHSQLPPPKHLEHVTLLMKIKDTYSVGNGASYGTEYVYPEVG